MALPMYIFYEVGIISAGIFNKKAKESNEKADDLKTDVGKAAAAPVGPAVPQTAMAGDSEYVGVTGPSGRRR
jgi:sec-independent protein translocase protein TatC